MASVKKKRKLRSGMEDHLVPGLVAQGCMYEPIFLRYAVKSLRRYIPDVVTPNGIAIEIKGWFRPSDRTKLLDVKRMYPALDLRLVLGRPETKLNKKSKTTLAGWCNANGIPFAAKVVPESWLSEPVNLASLAILNAAPRRKTTVSKNPQQMEMF